MELSEKEIKQLKKTFISLADAFDNETVEKNKELLDKIKEKFKESKTSEVDFIFTNFKMFRIDHTTIFKKAVEIPQNKRSWAYNFILNDELVKFVRSAIDVFERPCCGGDKESFVISRCIKAIREDENYILHDEHDFGKGLEKAYWSPTIFKDTDEVFDLFKKYKKELSGVIKNEEFSKIFKQKLGDK